MQNPNESKESKFYKKTKMWLKSDFSFQVSDAPDSRTPIKNPRITPEFRKGSPACGFPFITRTKSTTNPARVPNIAPSTGYVLLPVV
jgi:hypothetical protein